MSERISVLVVDDEVSARHIVAALLEPEGHELDFASSGQEALERLADRLPDVVLLDVGMPEMGGLEVCGRVKANPAWRYVPIILMTAFEGKEELARGLDAGAEDFLTKPVDGVELRARVRAMARIKRQYDELTRLMQLRLDLAHVVVHDMRSPLGVIIGYAELLASRASLGPDADEKVKLILAQAQVLNGFVSQMLVAAKVEEGKLVLNRSTTDVRDIVRATEEGHQGEAASRLVRLDVRLPPDPRPADVDVDLVTRVVDNLLSNALAASPPGGTVTVVVEHPKEIDPHSNTRIRVLDEGPGIPEDQRARIFEQYWAVTARAGVSQVSLGLTFCRMVAEAHGGRIFVEPNHPQGSVFTVEL
jgi:two-component system sensor histidine kinase/response regulator